MTPRKFANESEQMIHLKHHRNVFLSALLAYALVACGGGTGSGTVGNDDPDTDPQENPVNQEGPAVTVLTNETGLDFGPVNDTFVFLFHDPERDYRGLVLFMTDDATARNICDDPNDQDVNGFALMVPLVLADFGEEELTFIKPSPENILGEYGNIPADFYPGDGLVRTSALGYFVDGEIAGTEDPNVTAPSQNNVTLMAADLTPDGRVEGNLETMVFDLDGDRLGLLKMTFKIPFLCEVDEGLFLY